MFPISKKYINHRCGLHLAEYQKPNPDDSTILGIINSKGDFTACHKHQHITREKYNEVIPKIIDEFTNAGFYETEKFFEKNIYIQEEYKHLKKDITNSNNITAQKTSKSNSIIRKYVPHVKQFLIRVLVGVVV